MQTNNLIHIKAALNNEFRRFSMDNANYAGLVETIRSLYSIPTTETLKICYVDDEKDTVLLTSDEEFSYAAELVSPLKLVVTKALTPLTTPCAVNSTVEPTSPCRRGRGGHCGEFKARCESKKQWREEKLSLTKEERIARKTARISERIQHLQALPFNELPPHRQRCVIWKLENLRMNLILFNWCANIPPKNLKHQIFPQLLPNLKILEGEDVVVVEEEEEVGVVVEMKNLLKTTSLLIVRKEDPNLTIQFGNAGKI